jgi:retron-type reverse transcriptase
MSVILKKVSDDRSFGFRCGKSVHNAIVYIRRNISWGLWAIERDINNCFDRFDHKRLVSIARKKYINL